MNDVVAFSIGIVALATGIASLTSAIVAFRTRKHVKEVHVLVNSRMLEMVTRVNQLEATLKASNVDVPAPHEREA